jgi:hypothetical protein
LTAVYKFRKHWEEFEDQKLKEDRDHWFNEKELDAEIFNEERNIEIETNQTTLVEEFLNPPEPEEADDKKSPARPQSKLNKNESQKSVPEAEIDHWSEFEKKDM